MKCMNNFITAIIYTIKQIYWCNLRLMDYLPDMDKVSDKTVRGLLTPDLSRTSGCYELAKTCGKMKVFRHAHIRQFISRGLGVFN